MASADFPPRLPANAEFYWVRGIFIPENQAKSPALFFCKIFSKILKKVVDKTRKIYMLVNTIVL